MVHGRRRISQCHLQIPLIHQVFLVLMWLRKYPHVDTLSLWFDIDLTSVVHIIYELVPELWGYFQNQFSWPNLHERANLVENWPEFPYAVGGVDTTPHEIYRPLTGPQWPFYSGYCHYHRMNTHLVMDSEGNI